MTFLNEKQFHQKASVFLDELFSRLSDKSLELGIRSIDHLCYRVESLDEYEQLKLKLSSFSELLIESEVGGRMISTFKLSSPVYYKEHIIDLVELPAPKAKKNVKSGFEHLEIVITESFDDLIKRYSQLTFDTSTLMKKDFNQELKLDLDEFQIKFHYQSLESVINLELNKTLYKALCDLKVLSEFKEFNPLIPTTQCLGISNAKSDVDIIMQFDDINKFKERVRSYYGGYLNFFDEIIQVKDVLTYTAFFYFENVRFEIFAQGVHPVYQSAFKHFNIEEKIIKLGGNKLKAMIVKYKEDGLSTEASFTKALGIKGDPFMEILKLNKLSERELAKFIEGNSHD